MEFLHSHVEFVVAQFSRYLWVSLPPGIYISDKKVFVFFTETEN